MGEHEVPRVPVPSLDLSRKDVLMTLTECEETAEDGDELQPASASSLVERFDIET